MLDGRIPTIATTSPKRKSAISRLGEKASAVLAVAWGPILWTALAASAIATIGAGAYVFWADGVNSKIRQLVGGKDVVIDVASAPPALLEARAYFLLTRDNLADAQPLLDQAALRADDDVRVRMLYNMANARQRMAVKEIQQGQFDQAIPQVALAKAEYRSALRLDPGNWDIKHNLDVALRLVRDLPRQETEEDESNTKEPAKLWTDLPGVPKGLP